MPDIRSYDPGELDRFKEAYLADPERSTDKELSDQTWNDMNMDRIFARIDTCVSVAGEERLYAMLREPFCDATEISRRDDLIRAFDADKGLCDGYRKRLELIGNNIMKPVSVSLARLSGIPEKSSLPHILCALLGVFSVAMIFISPTAGLLIFLIALIINIPMYFRRKAEIGEYTACFSHIIKAFYASEAMLRVKDDEDKDYRREIRTAVRELSPVVRGSFLVTGGRGLTGGILNMLLDYLRIFFHIDLIKFNSMQKKVCEHRAEISRMYRALGEIDAFIAVSEYRRSLPYWCVPEYIADAGAGAIGLDVSELCHPLLDMPVGSDIHASYRGILITGSNASGKSTFLRSTALAAILGQSIATVYAESYRASRFHIISSMAVSDDIASGSSYYMAEIKALKRVMEACSSGEPVLCFVDEVLKGTNTIERIAASSEILKSLTGNNVICFAATHDIELTDILSDSYENYHFEEEIIADEIRFPYRLMKGKAVSRNAIKLLKIMGYGDSITESAERRAEAFEKDGVWERAAYAGGNDA